jgi:hypothetical protein
MIMKVNSVNTIFVFVIMAGMLSCDNIAMEENKYLGKLPVIAQKQQEKYSALENELENCNDWNKAFELQKELELLDEQNRKEVVDYLSTTSIIGSELPLEMIDYKVFDVQSVMIDTVYSNSRVLLEFSLKVKDGTPKQRITPFVFFKALDKDGKVIAGSISVGAGTRCNIDQGDVISAQGLLNAANLLKLDKIALISKEEYDAV